MLRTVQITLILALAAVSSQAGILITFNPSLQLANPGDLLHFNAVITNTGPDEVFFNADSITPLSADFTVNDLFFTNVPFSLIGGDNSGPIDLFDIQVGVPPYGLNTGTYILYDPNDQVLASADFAVQVVPEPATAGLIGISAVFAAAFARFRRRKW